MSAGPVQPNSRDGKATVTLWTPCYITNHLCNPGYVRAMDVQYENKAHLLIKSKTCQRDTVPDEQFPVIDLQGFALSVHASPPAQDWAAPHVDGCRALPACWND